MSNKYFRLHLLFTFLLICCKGLLVHAEDMQYENQLIERIEIMMMNQSEGCVFDASAITARIKTREEDFFCQNVFDNDLKILAQDFDRIEPNLDCIDGKVYITLKIWPKPTIRTITWIGNCKIATDKLQKELGVSCCAVFDRRAFNQAFHTLKAYYIKKGFFEAQLSYEIIPDPMSSQVDVEITISEGRSGWIKDIRFINFCKEEEDEILEKMITKEYSFFTSWMTEEGTYHEDAMQQDEYNILSYLQNEGYADARVNIEICEAKNKDRINILITAIKGNHYSCGKLSFKGNTLFCDEEVQKRFTIHEGSDYSPEAIRETITSISDLYGKYGYIDVYVDYEPKVSECNPYVYDIDFTIEEGGQYRVGLIKVFGNCSTQTQVILHEVLLIPGEVFNVEKLRKTEEKLSNIGFFKTVNAYAVKADEDCTLGGNFRDVHIEVEETSTGRFGAFAGFSTVESIFGGFNVSENNFNAAGLTRVFKDGLCAVRGGGEYAYITATIGAKSRSYVFSWNKPWFMDLPWVVGFDLERASNRFVSKDYDIKSTSFRLHGIHELNQFVRIALHYRIKNTHIILTEHHPSRQMREEINNAGLISAIGSAWIYDSTNHPMHPTSGFKSRAQAEYVGVGGKHTFFNVGYLNTFFFQPPKDEKGVWRVRWDLRFLQPVGRTRPDTIPLDERFFLGGDETVRGYRPYKLGPTYEDGDPRGGISLQYLSIEYSRPIIKRVDCFFFADSGHLSIKRWHFGRMNTAVGLGLKLAILPGMAPIVVGMGFPIHPRSRGDVKRFFLSVGGAF